jgi:hypothetical protein
MHSQQDRLVVADLLALHHILGSPMFGRVGMMYVLVDLMWGVQSVMGARYVSVVGIAQ